MSEIGDCKKRMRNSAKISMNKGYKKDWADTMFQVHVLELLEKIAKKEKRIPTEYQKKIGKLMKEGKTIKEAHKILRR